MKKTLSRLLSLGLAATLLLTLLAGCGGSKDSGSTSTGSTDSGSASSGTADSGKTYDLSFTIHDPATSLKTAYYEDLAKQVGEATDGKLNVTVYSAGSLVASTDVAEAVLNGVADIGWMCVPFFPNQFPLTEVVSLPMMAQSSAQASKVLMELYKQSPELQAETSQYKVFQMFTTPPLFLCSNELITTPDDLKGLTMRAPAGVSTEMMTAWGASPVNMGPGDIYQAIEKDVINGAVFEWAGIGPFKLTEVMKYYTELFITPNCYYVVMNKAKWESLPAEYQQVLDEIWGSDEASLGASNAFQVEYDQYRAEAMENPDLEIIIPTDEERALFQVAADEYIANWAEKNSTDSFDAQAYVDLARELFAQTPAK